MEIQQYTDVEAFYQAAEPLLLRNEAANCLPIGLCATLRQDIHAYGSELPYFATVATNGEVIAAALMTPPYNVTLVQSDHPAALDLIARDVLVSYDAIPGVNGPGPLSKQFADLWQELTGHQYHLHMAQRIYQLDDVQPVPTVPGDLRPITEADKEIVIAWLHAFHSEADERDAPRRDAERVVGQALTGGLRRFFVWDVEGTPVTLTGCAGPTPHGIRIGPVYTPPELRRKGYATACVAAVSQLLLDEGRDFVFLFTDLANPTSNHIYQNIGYRPVADVDLYAFEK